jgi:amidophosphoribosyltransferase
MSKSWYISRIVLLKNLLDLSKDLLFQCSSFITYVRSNIQVNIIDLEKTQQNFLTCPEESHFEFPISIADDIISSLINNIELVGHFSYNEQNSRQIQMRFIEDFLKTDYICNYVKTQSLCSVNLIYRKKSSEIERDKSIANWRYDLGKNLGQNLSDVIKNEIDIVIPVPETGKYYAQGLSNILEKPYVEAFYKKTEIGRSFDIADEEKRQNFLDSKLGILSDLVANKVVAIVDEAIFTGQTLKLVKSLLDSSSVEKIYFFIASPICSKKCNFNMMPDRKLLSSEYGQDDMVRYFNIQGIIFQDLKSFEDISFDAGFTCTKCFN